MSKIVYNTTKIAKLTNKGKLFTFEELILLNPKKLLECLTNCNLYVLSEEAIASLNKIRDKSIREKLFNLNTKRIESHKRMQENIVTTSDTLKEGNFSKTQYMFCIQGIRTGI